MTKEYRKNHYGKIKDLTDHDLSTISNVLNEADFLENIEDFVNRPNAQMIHILTRYLNEQCDLESADLSECLMFLKFDQYINHLREEVNSAANLFDNCDTYADKRRSFLLWIVNGIALFIKFCEPKAPDNPSNPPSVSVQMLMGLSADTPEKVQKEQREKIGTICIPGNIVAHQ